MRVLITGAWGNVGALTTELLVQRGYRVRAFDVDTPANRAAAAELEARVECSWGDIRSPESVRAAVADVDHVLHLAAVIPPVTDTNQLLGYEVNVGGMRQLIEACETRSDPPPLVFCSSPAVYGRNAEATGPRRADEALHPEDSYGRQKVECEQMLRASRLEHCIFRLAVTPPVSLAAISPFIFDFHPETRVEFTHPRDVALALVNTLLAREAMGKVLLIGGGSANRMSYLDFMNRALAVIGIEPLPASAFGPHRFYTDWLDSEESQHILQYRSRGFDVYLDEIRALVGPARHLIGPLEPVVRQYLLANSRYESAARGRRPYLVEAQRMGGLVARGVRGFAPYARAWSRRYSPLRRG